MSSLLNKTSFFIHAWTGRIPRIETSLRPDSLDTSRVEFRAQGKRIQLDLYRIPEHMPAGLFFPCLRILVDYSDEGKVLFTARIGHPPLEVVVPVESRAFMPNGIL